PGGGEPDWLSERRRQVGVRAGVEQQFHWLGPRLPGLLKGDGEGQLVLRPLVRLGPRREQYAEHPVLLRCATKLSRGEQEECHIRKARLVHVDPWHERRHGAR